MRIGLFGGTFDPVHVGHLDVARAARHALGLEAVWLIPARVPPHRRAPVASAAHRFAMAAMAVESDDGLLVSDIEMDVIGPSYTADTLARVQASGVDLQSACFVIGADAFKDIDTWKDYPRVLDWCHFAVVSRPGVPAHGLRSAVPAMADRMINAPFGTPVRPSILLIDASTAAVSSTDVRRAIAAGSGLDGMVPAAVAVHIDRHALYRPRHGDARQPQGTA
jgi:nicotinate-nucleotide adenylyltransferase